MRALVTGSTGFVGQHLVQLLAARGYAVYGTYFSEKPSRSPARSGLIRCDIRNARRLRTLLKQVRPDRIYHLAAQSSVTESLHNLPDFFETNFWGTFNLLEAAHQVAPTARVLVVGSGQCYGVAKSGRRLLAESDPLSPRSPYALSKAASDMLAEQYFTRYGLHVIRARSFNHTGPGQAPNFVCSDFARQVAAIDLGLNAPILHVGALGVRRDFTDVRDVVRAYQLLLEKGEPGGVYNVASGKSTSVRHIAELLIPLCSRSIKVAVQRQRLRTGEARVLCGSNRKLRRATGWKPAYDLHATLRDLFLWWRGILKSERS